VKKTSAGIERRRVERAHHRHDFIHGALVLSEHVEDAAGGGGVEEFELGVHHRGQHAQIQLGACCESDEEPPQVAHEGQHHQHCNNTSVKHKTLYLSDPADASCFVMGVREKRYETGVTKQTSLHLSL
jgi:hypothetical protein